MTDDDRARRLQEALEQNLDIRAGEVLAGWVIAFETARLDDGDPAVAFQRSDGMTSWRALGLLSWAEALLGPAGADLDESELDDEADS